MKNTVLDRVLLRFQVAYETGYAGLLISALFVFIQVYNPFLMNDLYELLKVQCKGCNKLRM